MGRGTGLPRCFFEQVRGRRQLEEAKYSRQFLSGLFAQVLIPKTVNTVRQLLAKLKDSLLVEGPPFDLLLESKSQPKIPVSPLIEAI